MNKTPERAHNIPRDGIVHVQLQKIEVMIVWQEFWPVRRELRATVHSQSEINLEPNSCRFLTVS